MATTTNTVLKAPSPFLPHAAGGSSSSSNHLHYRRITPRRLSPIRCRSHHSSYITTTLKLPTRSLHKFLAFASDVENMDPQTETQQKEEDTQTEMGGNTDNSVVDSMNESGDAVVIESTSGVVNSLNANDDAVVVESTSGVVDSLNANDDAVVVESTSGAVDSLNASDDTVVAESTPGVLGSLRLYREALSNNDDAKLAEAELFFKTMEAEKIDLENKLAALLYELSNEKARLLRTSVEFDTFRKRTENERLSLVKNAKEAVLEVLLPFMDDFERAKAQMKVENEGEEKVNNSYQSIYKQFAEILGSLQAVPVEEEKMDKPSDPKVSSQAGSRFTRVIDDFRQKLNGVYSGFTKNWIRK